MAKPDLPTNSNANFIPVFPVKNVISQAEFVVSAGTVTSKDVIQGEVLEIQNDGSDTILARFNADPTTSNYVIRVRPGEVRHYIVPSLMTTIRFLAKSSGTATVCLLRATN